MFDMSKSSSNKAKIKIKKIPSDCYTPVGVVEALNGKVLLESAYQETGKGRYSIILADEAFTIIKRSGNYILSNPNGKIYNITAGKKKYFDLLEEFRKRAPYDDKLSGLPVPLGGIGYLSYEFFSEIEEVSFGKENERDIDECSFIFGRNFIIFDHLHDEASIVSALYEGEIEDIDLDQEIKSIESRLKNNYKNGNGSNSGFTAEIVSPDDRDDYINKVKIIKDEIYKGNLLQCVLSRRLAIKTDIDPIQAYRNLRRLNPSPYMFYMKFDNYILFGASPEVMVKVDGRRVIVKPIAGTRKRGTTTALDLALENELKNDIKEKAEHLMLLDLGRNDVGKVSDGGSVKVNSEMVVERYSRVMHLVSEVEGRLSAGLTSRDAVYATFPAGTVSGAPKIQAIKTIEKLEEKRRGPYSGLVGYMMKDGSFDSCIVIRSAICRDGIIYLQAGAGIVYDSVPESEYEETQNKMLALLNALNIELK